MVNHTSSSEALIQSETALNAGETEIYSTDQLEARRQREHKDMRAMLFKLPRLVFYKTMDPTLHYKMKADEVYDGSGEGLQHRKGTRQT